MTEAAVVVVLSLLGIGLSLWGVCLSVRAIWDETHKRDLKPGWLQALEQARAQARHLRFWERDKAQPSQTARHGGRVRGGKGEATVADSAHGHAPPLTLEELRAHVEKEFASVRQAISAQANQAALRVDAVSQRLTQGLGAVDARIDAAEASTAAIDTHTLDRQMWGLLCVALGSILQACAVIVSL